MSEVEKLLAQVEDTRLTFGPSEALRDLLAVLPVIVQRLALEETKRLMDAASPPTGDS